MESENISKSTQDQNPWDDALLILAEIIADKHLAVKKDIASDKYHTDTTGNEGHKSGDDSQ